MDPIWLVRNDPHMRIQIAHFTLSLTALVSMCYCPGLRRRGAETRDAMQQGAVGGRRHPIILLLGPFWNGFKAEDDPTHLSYSCVRLPDSEFTAGEKITKEKKRQAYTKWRESPRITFALQGKLASGSAACRWSTAIVDLGPPDAVRSRALLVKKPRRCQSGASLAHDHGSEHVRIWWVGA